jgi:predicted protein tyrosine phosphatase
MNEVLIMSRRQAESMASYFGGNPVVSITDNTSEPARIQHSGEICRVSFPDSTYGLDMPYWEFTKLFKFLEQHRNAEQLIVHCEQGKSRSSAVALFCAEEYSAHADFRGKFPNLEVVRRLRELRDIRNRQLGEQDGN